MWASFQPQQNRHHRAQSQQGFNLRGNCGWLVPLWGFCIPWQWDDVSLYIIRLCVLYLCQVRAGPGTAQTLSRPSCPPQPKGRGRKSHQGVSLAPVWCPSPPQNVLLLWGQAVGRGSQSWNYWWLLQRKIWGHLVTFH